VADAAAENRESSKDIKTAMNHSTQKQWQSIHYPEALVPPSVECRSPPQSSPSASIDIERTISSQSSHVVFARGRSPSSTCGGAIHLIPVLANLASQPLNLTGTYRRLSDGTFPIRPWGLGPSSELPPLSSATRILLTDIVHDLPPASQTLSFSSANSFNLC
jgi:hypothetical protein